MLSLLRMRVLVDRTTRRHPLPSTVDFYQIYDNQCEAHAHDSILYDGVDQHRYGVFGLQVEQAVTLVLRYASGQIVWEHSRDDGEEGGDEPADEQNDDKSVRERTYVGAINERPVHCEVSLHGDHRDEQSRRVARELCQGRE